MTPSEQKIFNYMRDRVGVDVPIEQIASCLGVVKLRARDERKIQQYIGAFISRINKGQEEMQIVPGLELKRTYRMQSKNA